LGARYLDTGAMYRIVTLAVIRADVDLADTPAIEAAAADVPLSVGYDPDEDRAYLDAEDVSAEIRGDEVTKAVSAVRRSPRFAPASSGCNANWQRARAASSSRAATSARWCCPVLT
jgi:cytidylate kinase